MKEDDLAALNSSLTGPTRVVQIEHGRLGVAGAGRQHLRVDPTSREHLLTGGITSTREDSNRADYLPSQADRGPSQDRKAVLMLGGWGRHSSRVPTSSIRPTAGPQPRGESAGVGGLRQGGGLEHDDPSQWHLRGPTVGT